MLQRYNADGMCTSCTFQNATAKPHVAVQKCDKPPSNGHRSDVAVRKPENALARDEAADRVQKCDQCGQGGANLEVAYGTAHGFVHRGPCETAWIADRDDDLTIPAYLNRRAEARQQQGCGKAHSRFMVDCLSGDNSDGVLRTPHPPIGCKILIRRWPIVCGPVQTKFPQNRENI